MKRLILLAFVLLAGCATAPVSNTENVPVDQNGAAVTIPATSKFAKISFGMPIKQVYDLIGAPTDTKTYITGKTFIPFYFGDDGARIESFYKGEGRVTFAGGTGLGGGAFKVYGILYNPSESGYNQ